MMIFCVVVVRVWERSVVVVVVVVVVVEVVGGGGILVASEPNGWCIFHRDM